MNASVAAASLPRRSAGGAFWVMLEGGIAQILALVFFAIIARLTDPHAYGLVAVSLALLETVRAVLVDVLATVLTSNRLAQKDDWDGAHWLTIAWCLVLTIISAATAPLLAWALGVPDLTPVLQLLSLNFVLYGAGRVPEGYLNQQMRFRPLALRTVRADRAATGDACGILRARPLVCALAPQPQIFAAAS
jgi:PST family polysaccharide transporter